MASVRGYIPFDGNIIICYCPISFLRSRHMLEVDGGVDNATAPQCVEAGADILVAGSAVFGAADPAAAVQHLASL